MKVYTKYIILNFLKSFFYVFVIMLSLVFILNLLNEIVFFESLESKNYLIIYLTFLNSPSLIFEMFPFIFLISTQLFFVNLFKDNQIEIFKYSGLKNSKIITIISFFSFFLGLFAIIFFYNISANLKNFYLELKSNYTTDNKYLAVITNNGLWIKDKIDDKILIVNSLKIENNFLINSFITEFDQNYDIIRNIKSEKIDILNNEWLIYDAISFIGNTKINDDLIKLNSNFNYENIKKLFSNLSSLTIFELFNLKKNYSLLGYSVNEIDLYIYKLFSYPIYYLLMVILSSFIMFNSKKLGSNTFKISLGLFLSVIIYYINNLFYVFANSERIPLGISISLPLAILILFNFMISKRINEK